MLNRVKQVISAVTAKLTAADRKFISDELNHAEELLFYGMNLPDQRHALNVAYTILDISAKGMTVDRNFLVRCALLHDIGKVQGDVSTWDKIITVLAHGLAPHWAESWGRYGRGSSVENIRHAFYIYFHHAERGAQVMEALGEDAKLVDMIRRHHDTPLEDEPRELTLLRQADNLN